MPSRNRSQRGNSLIEFGLVMVFIIPLLFGTVALGVNLGRGIQAAQISRDIANMFARGVDFSQPGNQTVARTLAQGFDLTSTGNGVLILSEIITVYQADCDAAGYTTGCANLGSTVFTNRVVIGKSSLRASNFGTPNAAYLNAQGNISANNYLLQSSCVATGFATLLAQSRGDVAWVVEAYFATTDLSFLGAAYSNGSGGVYARAIF